MALVPITLAVTLVRLVVWVSCELFFLPLAFACALAVFMAAIALVLYSGILVKDTPTKGGRVV